MGFGIKETYCITKSSRSQSKDINRVKKNDIMAQKGDKRVFNQIIRFSIHPFKNKKARY